MDKIRVNKITVNVDKYGDVTISLYRTNVLLGTLTNADLDIPDFDMSGVPLKTYQMYCRDFVIELLGNDGIPGYYYEPKSEQHAESIKYEVSTFKKGVLGYIDSLLDNKYKYSLIDYITDITDRYKDMYIKNAVGEFNIMLNEFNIMLTVISEIKSGQLCRPKIIRHNDSEHAFNITSVKKIIKSV